MRLQTPFATHGRHAWRAVLVGLLLAGAPASHAQLLPGQSYDWDLNGFYEFEARYRDDDATGDPVGLSKLRNTFQLEATRRFRNGWQFHTTLRGTYDGVFDLNDEEFGDRAGGAVRLDNSAAPAFAGGPFLGTPTVAWGGGLNNANATTLGLPPSNTFGFNATNPGHPRHNPNEGMQILGERWHPTGDGGLEFAVPVRPCDVDGRGCADFGGYGDLSKSGLAFPEFNDDLDVIRELYVRRSFRLGNGDQVYLKLGRQQVVWGRTDLFRVLDVINPIDYSRNNIYDELEDIRIPQWIIQGEYRFGPSDWMQERSLQVVWNVDKFRPSNLGQCGNPNSILDAGCFLRTFKNLWDNGGTVGNFAYIGPGMYAATDFGPGQVGIRDIHLPDWKLSNTQLGLRFEGVAANGISFSLNALTTRSQLPSLRSINGAAENPFTGTPGNTTPPAAGTPVTHLVAFDLHYPRVNLIGGSLDFQWKSLGAAVRIETALTDGEEFANTLRPELYSESDVLRSVIGIDRPTFVPFISPDRTMLISFQLFHQRILDHELEETRYGEAGMAVWEDNFNATLLLQANYLNGRLLPRIVFAHDFEAEATAIGPAVEYLVNNNLQIAFGANFKLAETHLYQFDDCRTCNPYPPFSAEPVGHPVNQAGPSLGMPSYEPLGRFRAGPIGAAAYEDEAFVRVRMTF